jgi:hypothetical protein
MSHQWRDDDMAETRSQLIWRHANELINRSAVSWPSFATQVREIYYTNVPAHLRRVQFSDSRDIYERARLDAQELRRFEHDRKWGLPADLEEAMVQAMAVLEYRQMDILNRELAARYGMLPAPIPTADLVDDAEGVQGLMKETGEAIAAVLEIAPGGITPEDADLAKSTLQQINEALAELVSMQARITRILPDQQAPKVRVVL